MSQIENFLEAVQERWKLVLENQTKLAKELKVARNTVLLWLGKSSKLQHLPSELRINRVLKPFGMVASDLNLDSATFKEKLKNRRPQVEWWQSVLKNTSNLKTQTIFGQLQGLWEVYHHGFSAPPLLSLELLNIDRINPIDDRLIDCEWTDYDDDRKPIAFEGHVMHFHETLCFFEEESEGDEIAVYFVHLRSRPGDLLYGVMAGLSGYGGHVGRTPSAAKVCLRRLGRPGDRRETWEMLCRRCSVDLTGHLPERSWGEHDADKMLDVFKENIGDYIDPLELGVGNPLRLGGNLSKETEVIKEIKAMSDDLVPFKSGRQIFLIRSPESRPLPRRKTKRTKPRAKNVS
jgi:hypothetical protein